MFCRFDSAQLAPRVAHFAHFAHLGIRDGIRIRHLPTTAIPHNPGTAIAFESRASWVFSMNELSLPFWLVTERPHVLNTPTKLPCDDRSPVYAFTNMDRVTSFLNARECS